MLERTWQNKPPKPRASDLFRVTNKLKTNRAPHECQLLYLATGLIWIIETEKRLYILYLKTNQNFFSHEFYTFPLYKTSSNKTIHKIFQLWNVLETVILQQYGVWCLRVPTAKISKKYESKYFCVVKKYFSYIRLSKSITKTNFCKSISYAYSAG